MCVCVCVCLPSRLLSSRSQISKKKRPSSSPEVSTFLRTERSRNDTALQVSHSRPEETSPPLVLLSRSCSGPVRLQAGGGQTNNGGFNRYKAEPSVMRQREHFSHRAGCVSVEPKHVFTRHSLLRKDLHILRRWNSKGWVVQGASSPDQD